MLYPWLQNQWEQIKSGNLKTFQPLLIAGADGRGQWCLAKQVANAFLCEANQRPCGVCQSCHMFQSESHPDMWFLADQEKETISIDTARLIGEHTLQKPLRAEGCRVVLVEHFDNATIAAQQSLLKVFEEPFVKTAIVLTARRLDRVIPTIRSRMSVVNVPPVSRVMFKHWCEENRIAFKDWYYDFTDGSPLLLLAYDLEKLSALKEAIESNASNVYELSKSFDRSVLYSLMYHHLAQRAQKSLDLKDFERLDKWQALYQEVGMSKSMNWQLNIHTFM